MEVSVQPYVAHSTCGWTDTDLIGYKGIGKSNISAAVLAPSIPNYGRSHAKKFNLKS